MYKFTIRAFAIAILIATALFLQQQWTSNSLTGLAVAEQQKDVGQVITTNYTIEINASNVTHISLNAFITGEYARITAEHNSSSLLVYEWNSSLAGASSIHLAKDCVETCNISEPLSQPVIKVTVINASVELKQIFYKTIAGEQPTAKPTQPSAPAQTLTQPVTSFSRNIDCPGCGQHKTPPTTYVTITVSATSDTAFTNLSDIYSNEWLLPEGQEGTVQAYNATHNIITWQFAPTTTAEKIYTLYSPERTLPPTKYYFTTLAASSSSEPWQVIVADPVDLGVQFLREQNVTASVGGYTYMNLSTAAGPGRNSVTNVKNGKNIGNFTVKPGGQNTATGTRSTTVPQGFGWAVSSLQTGTIQAGTWTFNILANDTSSTGTGVIGIDIWRKCAGANTSLFYIQGTTNVLNNATTTQTVTTSQPAFVLGGDCYVLAEYWLNVTTAGTSATAVMRFWVNGTENNLSMPTLINNVSSATLNDPTATLSVNTGNTFYFNCSAITDASTSGIESHFQFNSTSNSAYTDIPTSGGNLTINLGTQSNAASNTIYNRTVTANDVGNYSVRCRTNSTDASANSSSILVNVTQPSNQNPKIDFVQIPPAQDPIEDATKTVFINFTASDPDGTANLNDSTSKLIINSTVTKTGVCSLFATTSANKTYNCSAILNYYDPSGPYTINVTVQDNSAVRAENISTSFTYNELQAIVLDKTVIGFGTVALQQTDAAATDNPLTIDNTGNVNFTSISVRAFDLRNLSVSSTIFAENFSVNLSNFAPGYSLANNSPATIPSSRLEPDTASGESNRTLYFFVDTGTGLSPVYYTSISPWQVNVSKT